ncbi:MAG TPA: SRPBCC family protein [Stellaceae bacterium]|nr:SRPBCC family protein [Stellaceae bacterium]
MTGKTETPAPLKVSRTFPAPAALVFKAWSTAEHVKRWFSPETYTVPEAKIEMRVGGAFDVCMRSPAGVEHWTRGTFVEVVPPHHGPGRLVIDMRAVDAKGAELFRALTEVTFTDDVAGTRMEVVQTYRFTDPKLAAPMVAGASEGWRTTLDKLARELTRMRGAAAVRSVVHASFALERRFDAPRARVWAALTEEKAKSQWFASVSGQWELVERHMEVRVGGRERLKGRWKSGMVSTFDATYYDVVPLERLVYTYEMHLDDKKISVSLATMELKEEGGKTRLIVTEQGAFLDGYDDAGSREHGTGQLLDALGASLK